MYITKYGCVFLKLGESTIDNTDYVVSIIYKSTYMAMDLIPILLGSLPLAHNAQHSLVIIWTPPTWPPAFRLPGYPWSTPRDT